MKPGTSSVTARDMHILQAGVPKSGNLWVYRVLQAILDSAGVEKRSFVKDYRRFIAGSGIQSASELFGHDVLDIEQDGLRARLNRHTVIPIHDAGKYVETCTHVWTHSRLLPAGRDVVSQFDRVVYIVRDPRDVAISLSHFMFLPRQAKDMPVKANSREAYLARSLPHVLRNWVENLVSFLEVRDRFNVHLLFYERLLANFPAELDELLKYLEVHLSAESRMSIERATSLESMKQRESGHVRRGEAYKWREELNAAQQRRALRLAGPLLELLGYPVVPGDDRLPSAPAAIPESSLDTALRRTKRLVSARIRAMARALREARD